MRVRSALRRVQRGETLLRECKPCQGEAAAAQREGEKRYAIAQTRQQLDLNTLIPADSPWFLIEALGINNRGQITGYALNAVTSDVHGVVLTPDPDSESSASAGRAGANRLVALPENARQMLQRMNVRFHRFESYGASMKVPVAATGYREVRR